MSESPIRGATGCHREMTSLRRASIAHMARPRRTTLLWRLAREAYGDEYPDEIQAWGMTTWWTLGQFIAGITGRSRSAAR